jgi:hypothetical protein
MRPATQILLLGALTLTMFQIGPLMNQMMLLPTEEISLSFLPTFNWRAIVVPEQPVVHSSNETTVQPREVLKPSSKIYNNHLHQPINSPENATPRTTTSMDNSTISKKFLISHHPHDNNITDKNEPTSSSSLHRLPQWIQNYVAWHQEMRAKFPGSSLVTDPTAPKLLVRTCFNKCGGLHDRLGKLPWDLYLANQTNRILLLHWCFPAPLETFLIPNLLDWTLPHGLLKTPTSNNKKTCPETVQKIREFFEGHASEKRPGADFWNRSLDSAILRAKNDTEFLQTKILRHELLGMDFDLSKRLQALHETDMLSTEPSFGTIFFDVFFQPSPELQVALNQAMQQLPPQLLETGQYSAAHCRVRHPKATPPGARGKVEKAGGADKWGLLFDGMEKDYAIATANKAIQCAQKHLQQPDEPIYFYADSEDLVRYMPTLYPSWSSSPSSLGQHETTKTNYTPSLRTGRSPLDSTQNHHQNVSAVQLVTRTITGENLHIDRQEANDPAQFYGTFVDLWIAAHARCVAFGVGNYAYFAYKLSGTSCGLRYQEEFWDSDGGDKISHSTRC